MACMVERFSPFTRAAAAMPAAALMLVLEWPTPKVSYSLSPRWQKGISPPSLRIDSSLARRPVSILCG